MKSRFPLFLICAILLPAGLGGQSVLESRKLFLKAHSAMADGKYREALDLYRRVIVLDPDNAVVRYEYAQLLRDLNVADEAGKQAREAVRLDPNMAEAHRLLGALELAAAESDPSRTDLAIEELRSARKLAPGDVATGVTLARALLGRGRPAEAARLFDEIPETRTQPALMRMAAEARAKAGRLKEAEEVYRQILDADPADREISAALVDLYEEEDRLDAALVLLRDLEKKDPDNSAAAERITLDLARAGRFEEAEKRARELATRRPENRAIRRLLAQVLFEKADAAGGEKILRDLLQTDPEDETARRELAQELVREKRIPEARTLWEESLRRLGSDPKNASERSSVSVELGFLSYLEKDYAAARKTLETVAAGGGGAGARATRILFAVARDSEDLASGLARAKTAAAAEKENSEWIAAVAEFQYRSGDRKSAAEALDRLAASEEPDRVLAAADAYARVKDFASAVRVAREAAKRFPESSEALFRLGSSLERAGNTSESEKVFLDLLRLRPNDAAAENYLGYMWADRAVNLERARELLEKAVTREPRNGAFRDSLGWVYFRQGKLAAARTNLQDASRREPDDPTIEEHLGDLSERDGSVEKAVVHWERALTLKPEEPEKIRKKLSRHAHKASGKP